MDADKEKPRVMPRRTVLKALAGFLGFQVLKKSNYDSAKRSAIIKELGLDSIEFPVSDYGTKKPAGNLIRVGIIGFGTRANQLSNALGFMYPDDVN